MLMGMEGLLRRLGEQVLAGVEYGRQLGLLRLLLHIAKGLVHLGYLLEDALGLVRFLRGGRRRIGLELLGKLDQALPLNSANERGLLFGGLARDSRG